MSLLYLETVMASWLHSSLVLKNVQSDLRLIHIGAISIRAARNAILLKKAFT